MSVLNTRSLKMENPDKESKVVPYLVFLFLVTCLIISGVMLAREMNRAMSLKVVVKTGECPHKGPHKVEKYLYVKKV
jgi:uncharacterized membrane protein YadS